MRADVKIALGAALLVLVALASPPALAQAGEKAKSFSIYISNVATGDGLGLKSDTGYGFAFSGQLTPYIGLEGGLQFNQALEYDLVPNAETDLREVRIGALFFFNRPHDKIMPYVALGLEYLETDPPAGLDSDILREEALDKGRSPTDFRYSADAATFHDAFGINWGLGIHFFVKEHLALRLDARFVTSLGKKDFTNFEPMFGLTWWVGAAE